MSSSSGKGNAPPPEFSSAEEEIAFWKSKAREAREELEEYQESSKELEAELETQLEQAEAKIKDYRSLSNRLQMDYDQIKDKLEQCQREYHYQVSELQSELVEIKSIRDQLNKYVRDLEQQNDDLERAKRSTIASLEDFEARLNAAIERNAFLESELDDKESLKAAVQRMKDETRDLKSELRVLAPRHPNFSSLDSSSSRHNSIDLFLPPQPDNDRKFEANNNRHNDADSNKLAADCESKNGELLPDTPPSSSKSSPKANGGANHLTPSARISALNIVGDLLRKVGALELKLVSCRNIVKDSSGGGTVNGGAASSTTTPGTPNSHESGAATANGIDRSRRIPRGSSTPAMKKIIDS